MFKIESSKTIYFFIIIVTLIVIFFISAYYMFFNYRVYTLREHTLKHIFLIERLDALLNDIDNEKLNGAIHIGTKSKDSLDNIKIYRDLVNSDINKILLFLDKNGEEKHFSSVLNSIFSDLNYIRGVVGCIPIRKVHYRGCFFFGRKTRLQLRYSLILPIL